LTSGNISRIAARYSSAMAATAGGGRWEAEGGADPGVWQPTRANRKRESLRGTEVFLDWDRR
jgi:hypothetical protein